MSAKDCVRGLPVLLFLVVLSACGGGEDAAPAPAPAPNRAPVAAAGVDLSGNKGASIALSGAASTDADGDSLVYRWTQTSGPTVTLSSASAVNPGFTAPAQSAVLAFSLIVNDGKTDSAADTVQVTIANRAPVANAGSDGVTETGELFSLNGTSSSDPDADALLYTWTQLSGPAVTLVTIAPGVARFSAPGVTGPLEFSLTVSDGEVQSTADSVAVTVQSRTSNSVPLAYSSGNFSMPKRSQVSLTGGGFDPEGRPVTYEWRQVSGTPVTLADANTTHATFTAPSTVGALAFELRVSDGVLTSLPVRVVVTIYNSRPFLQSTAGITPAQPRTADTLSIAVISVDGDNDPLTLSYTWRRNGVVVTSESGNTFPSSLTTRGDAIALSVSASDGTESYSVDFSASIGDTLPVLTATAPTTANYNDSLSFTVSATDADGDVIGPFEVLHGPAGFAVSNAGLATWQVTGPMFDRSMDFHWRIGLRDHPQAVVGAPIRVTDASRRTPLSRSGIVVPARREQLQIGDLDGDGVPEILVSNSRLLAAMNKSGAGWVQTWASPFQMSANAEASIDAIAVANVTGNAAQEIFVATTGHILQLEGPERRVRRQYDMVDGEAHCTALRVADIDGNGSSEVVCRRADAYYGFYTSTLLVLDANDLTLRWSVPVSVGGESLAVGNVDADPALEIVLGEGYVFDGATHANEWLYGPGFGQSVDIGDFDGNGVGEIAAEDGSRVKVFNAVAHSPLVEFTASSDLGELKVADLDGNGRSEVLVGDGQWGDVKVYSFNTGTQQFALTTSINSQDHGVSAIAFGNTDADPATEVVWGTGLSSSGQDILVVAEYTGTLSLDWSSEAAGQVDGPYIGALLSRITPSTKKLLFLSPSSRSGYGGSLLLTMDPVLGTVAQSPEISSNFSGLGALDVADYDGDGVDEGFLSTSYQYNGYLAAYDFATSATKWQSPLSYANGVAASHADMTGDGAADFVVIGSDGKISVVDPLHSTSVWQSTTLNSGVDIAAADLNQDGRPELVALTASFLYVYGNTAWGAAFTESGNTGVMNAVDLLVADIEGSARPEIIVLAGSNLGIGQQLRIYNQSLQLLRVVELETPTVTLAVEPGSGARRNILLGTGAPAYYYSGTSPATAVRAIDAVSGALVWESPALPGAFTKNSLRTVDIDTDGVHEIAYGTNVAMNVTR